MKGKQGRKRHESPRASKRDRQRRSGLAHAQMLPVSYPPISTLPWPLPFFLLRSPPSPGKFHLDLDARPAERAGSKFKRRRHFSFQEYEKLEQKLHQPKYFSAAVQLGPRFEFPAVPRGPKPPASPMGHATHFSVRGLKGLIGPVSPEQSPIGRSLPFARQQRLVS